MKKRLCMIVAFVLVAVFFSAVLYRYNYIPHKKYDDSYFGIETYTSTVDYDNDGVDDQTDILNSALIYLSTKPKYKSRYYAQTGYPDDNCGVCTDVVAFALLGAGYDLMELVDADVRANPQDYDIESPDKYIDFRRVENLHIYFENNAMSLTTDTTLVEQWQAGDIVVFERHIALVSDHRNRHGLPFVYHNAHILQLSYEEDVLDTWGRIIGHYRVS